MKKFRVLYKENDVLNTNYTVQERCLFFWFNLCSVSTLEGAIEHIRWCKEERDLKRPSKVVYSE
nr:MAG TPA: hypothetical protein [Caudoviricetes sp.]